MGRKRIRRNRPRAFHRRREFRWGLGIVRLLFGGLGVLCLSLLFVLGYDIVTQGEMFSAKRIEVTGNKILSESRILTLAGIAPGSNIFSVNLSLARKRLLSNGWVAEARVGREIPDKLTVSIREHEAVALLDLGKTYILSREGTIIKAWEETDPKLPLVTGLSYADLPLGEAPEKPFAAILTVLGLAGKDKGPLSLPLIERIAVDRDLGITLHATGGVKRAWIGYENFSEKYERLERLMSRLGRPSSDTPLEIFDLESDTRVVAGPFPEAAEDAARRS